MSFHAFPFSKFEKRSFFLRKNREAIVSLLRKNWRSDRFSLRKIREAISRKSCLFGKESESAVGSGYLRTSLELGSRAVATLERRNKRSDRSVVTLPFSGPTSVRAEAEEEEATVAALVTRTVEGTVAEGAETEDTVEETGLTEGEEEASEETGETSEVSGTVGLLEW